MDTNQPNALRLAELHANHALAWTEGSEPHRLRAETASELRRLHAENEALRTGYNAARLEIESLQTRIQELGQQARECSDRKVVQLESALARHVRSGKDWSMRVEALERTITTLRAHIASRNAQAAAAEKAMRELESANSIALQLDARIKELEAQLDAVGAGGVEPLRKRECLHQIAEPAREFPTMTPELASILGFMCFQCAAFAQALRAGGRQIKTRAEDEQAAVLHWMLSHYFRHGEEWRTAAADDMQRMQAEAQAKKGAQA